MDVLPPVLEWGMKNNFSRVSFPLSSSINGEGRGGFFDRTRETTGTQLPFSVDRAGGEKTSVESALFSLCHELAGVMLRRIQEQHSPQQVREQVCGELEGSGKFPRAQAESLVALAIELIRAKANGSYLRQPKEFESLIEKALGANDPESLN